MVVQYRRIIFWGLIGLLLLAGLVFAFWPRAISVDLIELKAKTFKLSISEEGKTRVHDMYTLSAPVTGYLRRIVLEVGDPVIISETVVAQIEPIDPAFLDPRSEAQAKADVQAAESAKDLAKAEVSQAQAELEFAFAEFKRMRELQLKNSVSKQELDNSNRAYKTRRAALASSQARLQVRKYELDRVKATLLSPKNTLASHNSCECMDIKSPVDGTILNVLNKSEGVVNAGTPLMDIGNPKDLEIIVELLSSDAVQVETGQYVYITNWGGKGVLEGQVSRIEPIGFTKFSALGIEEQRVNVIISISSPSSDWQRLGHGYQVAVEIVLFETENVLTLPLTALFREDEKWAVFIENAGIAEKRMINIGAKNTFDAEVIEGLEIGDWVILHPDNRVSGGTRIISREEIE
jgi:HlyD family secretion protein